MRDAIKTVVMTLVVILGIAACPQQAARACVCGTACDAAIAKAADGKSDVSDILQCAIDMTATGGILQIPSGFFRVTKTLWINRPITFAGTGFGTQIYMPTQQTMLQTCPGGTATTPCVVDGAGLNVVTIRDLYLGSASSASQTALIKLTNTHHSRIEGVTMLGGYYGLWLNGSLLDTVADLRSGTNFGAFFNDLDAVTSHTNTWVYADVTTDKASNANTFVAPTLEGGTNGLVANGHGVPNKMGVIVNGGQTSLTILGGSIEGVSGTGLALDATALPTLISNVHLEANGTADVVITDAGSVTIDSFKSDTLVNVAGTSHDITVVNAAMQTLQIGPATQNVRVENSVSSIDSCKGGIFDQGLSTTILTTHRANQYCPLALAQ